MSVRRIYVEKRQDYAVKAKELKDELKTYLGISGIDSIRILIRYDMENISDEVYKKALVNVFSEPPVDNRACKRRQGIYCRVYAGAVRSKG